MSGWVRGQIHRSMIYFLTIMAAAQSALLTGTLFGHFFNASKRRQTVQFSVLLRQISLKCGSIPAEIYLAEQKMIQFFGSPPI